MDAETDSDSGESPILRLMPELLTEIFVRLHFIDRLNCKLVCRHWHELINGNAKMTSDQWLVFHGDKRQTEKMQSAIRVLTDGDQKLRSVFKFEFRLLNRDWSLPSDVQFWTTIGGCITHLHLKDCTFSPADFIAMLQSFKCLISLNLVQCSAGESAIDIGEVRENLREHLSGLKVFKFQIDKCVLPWSGCSASWVSDTILLELFSDILDMQSTVQHVNFSAVPPECHARFLAGLDRYRNVCLEGETGCPTNVLVRALHLPNLTIRDLSIGMYGGVCGGLLLEGIRRHAHTLRGFNINFVGPTPKQEWMQQFLDITQAFTELYHFGISLPSFESGGLKVMQESADLALSRFEKLRTLNIGVWPAWVYKRDPTSDVTVPYTASAWYGEPPRDIAARLCRLNLGIDAPLMSRIPAMKQLTILLLQRSFDDRLLQLVFEHMLQLRCLVLNRGDITDIGLTGVPRLTGASTVSGTTAAEPCSTSSPSISNLRNLETLELSSLHFITNESLIRMNIPSLKRLRLYSLAMVNDAGVECLLRSNPNVEYLELARLKITQTAIINMLPWKPQHSPLFHLRIHTHLQSQYNLSLKILLCIEKHCPYLRYFSYRCPSQLLEENVASLVSRRSNLAIEWRRP